MKKLLILLFGATLVLGLAACSDLNETSASELYVSIDINPSIEFLVDEDGLITSYLLVNEDAKLLCVDVDFIGMNIDEATELFVNMATEAGFIDIETEDNAVLLTVYGDKEQYSNTVRTRLRERLVNYMAKNYIHGVVMDEGYTTEEIEESANELGITPGKLKLIYAAQLGDPDLTVEEGIELSVKNLMAKVKNFHNSEINDFTDEELAEYRLEKAALIQRFQNQVREHVQANPVMTNEELQEKVATMLRENYSERLENWENVKEIYNQKITQRKAETANQNSEDNSNN